MAAIKNPPKFPATQSQSAPAQTVPERALARGKKTGLRRGVTPQQAIAEVKTRHKRRREAGNKAQAKKPNEAAPKTPTPMSPEAERSRSIGQALIKGAAMAPNIIPQNVKGSRILQGALGGASVGLDINAALQQYRMRKKEDSAANAVTKMQKDRQGMQGQPSASPQMPVSTGQLGSTSGSPMSPAQGAQGTMNAPDNGMGGTGAQLKRKTQRDLVGGGY